MSDYVLPSFVKEKDGPPMHKCSWHDPYFVLTESGIKEEGRPMPGDPRRTLKEAWRDFQYQLMLAIPPTATQLEWRVRPEIKRPPKEKGFHVYSRLAVR